MNIIYHPTYKFGSTKWVCIHHSGGLGQDNFISTQHLTAENINQAHKERWNYISSLGWFSGYNFFIDKKGYPRYRKSRKLVHRVVAEKKLGRKLRRYEVVHHQDGNAMNFNKKNLGVMSRSFHSRLHRKMERGRRF